MDAGRCFILTLAATYMAMISLYTAGAVYLTDIHWWIPYVVFMSSSTIFTTIHRLGHYRTSNVWYVAHTRGHHIAAYTGKQFMSSVYITNVYDPYRLNTMLYMLAGVTILGISAYLWMNMLQTAAVAVFMLLVAYWEDLLHYNLHISTSTWQRWKWFNLLRAYHHIHHTYPYRQNYAIGMLFIDALLGTLVHPYHIHVHTLSR